jgi:hypothetical protein
MQSSHEIHVEVSSSEQDEKADETMHEGTPKYTKEESYSDSDV